MIKMTVLQLGAIGWAVVALAAAVLHASATVAGVALAVGIVVQLVACGATAKEPRG